MSSHALADKLGGPPLTVTLAGAPVPDLGAVSIRHGRSDAEQPVAPARCTLTIDLEHLPRLPTIADPLLVELSPAALAWAGLTGPAADAARVRFTGHITDVAATPERRGTPPRVTVTAASRRSRLGRTMIGDAPWPAEDDGARAARILGLAAPAVGAPLGTVDEGTVTVLARDVDRQPALQLLDALAFDSGGQLAERRDGTLEWHDALHRRRSAVDVELTAGDVLADVVAAQRLAGIVNRAAVVYGVQPEGGERPVLLFTDPDSESTFGPFGASITTQLSAEADAYTFARLLVGRRSRPVWELEELRLELTRTITPAVAGQLWQLEHADVVRVVGFPATGPFEAARLWVEGWDETVHRDGWDLTLNVSDYGRSGVEPRWLDINPAVRWQDAELTWLQVVGWDSGEFAGVRWVDMPADQRWRTYDPTVTWTTAAEEI